MTFGTSAFAAGTPPTLRLGEVEDIQPTGYRVELTLDPAKDTYTGDVAIGIRINKPLDTIWLNQEKLQIRKAVLTSQGAALTPRVIPGGDNFVGFAFDHAIPAGDVTLEIQYAGEVFSKISSGIFHQQESGNWYLFTQFENTDARAAFPSFDEPSYKTPWQLTLHFPVADSAVSNTSPASENVSGATRTVVFKETKPLPSYLVAFAVGPFEYVNAGTAGRNKVPVRIVVPKGKTAEAQYAASITATILTRLEDYFGIPYPYDKSDQVAIPNTLGFGAMENAGMVTYAQNILLADPKVDRIARQRTCASDEAHELAHQWFGDLVTTAWWDDIWLNEAFATWMERKIIAEWKPEWQTRVADVSAKLGAERTDSLVSARQIRQPIHSMDDINDAFDNITYEKGASVIGMFENWMGPEEFRKGVQSYLRTYSFRAATAGEFLDALSSSSKRDVTAAFSTFLNQPGVPVVSVAVDCAGSKPVLKAEQKRFLPIGSKGSADKVWSIPLCVRYGNGANGRSQCTLMKQRAETIVLDATKSCPAWIEADDNAEGYYRADYSGGLLAALTSGDVTHRLNAAERTELLGNEQALSDAGSLPAAEVLRLVDVFHNDPERHVVQSAMSLALRPQMHLVPENLVPNYERFLRQNFDAQARQLGWSPKPNESDDERILRSDLVPAMATTARDEELAGQAKELANNWLATHTGIDPNMLRGVLGTAAYYGDLNLFNRMLAEYKKTQDKQIRRALMGALTSFRDRAAIEAGMNALVNGEVPYLEGRGLLFGGDSEEATRKLSFEYIQAHWDKIVAGMPRGGDSDFGEALPRAGAAFCDARSRDEFKAFFGPRVGQFVGAARAFNQTLESIDLCIARKAAQEPGVTAFLAKY